MDDRIALARKILDYPLYYTILGPMWTPVLQGVLATRAYDNGFEFALRLLEATEPLNTPPCARPQPGPKARETGK